MQLDLFKLYNPREDIGAKSQISCSGNGLNSIINTILKEINSNGYKISPFCKSLSIKLKYHPDTILKMLRNKNNISIAVLEELLNEWKCLCKKSTLDYITLKTEIQSKITYLYCGSKYTNKIKAVKGIDINLAKIVGAHQADGCLIKEKTRNGTSYKFMIIDYYKSNLIAFNKWVFKTFKINLKIKKDRTDAWIITARNKILGRYLEVYFNFPSGNKILYSIPKIIKNSSNEIKRSYIIGFLTFEGCVEMSRNISLGIKNENLRDEICEILRFNSAPFKKRNINLFSHFRTGILNNKELQIWKKFFEKNTDKWFKINDYLNGFKYKTNNENEAMKRLNLVFKNNNYKVTNLENVIKSLKKVQCCDKFYLAKKLGIGVSTLQCYLHILKMANIIKKTNHPKIFPIISSKNEDAKLRLSKKLNNIIFSKIEKLYSIKEMCNKLKISQFTYYNWKNNKSSLSISKLLLIKKLLNIKININEIESFNKNLLEFNNNYKEWIVPDRPWFNSLS
ncbi:MAG: hypothetical protein PHF86_03580 [Candidatus Nanoarchaeia archaeon]|nr:hypothetical protein [Candidatus Nanoarchaeia archaeon]